MRKYIGVIFIAFFPIGSVSAFDGKSAQIKDPNNKNIFHSVNDIACHGAHISIVESCFILDKTSPDNVGGAKFFCYSDNISFLNFKNMSINVATYRHEWNSVVNHSINRTSCVTTQNKKKYVVVYSSSLGNCKNCEWSDVFSIDGNYIGSTPYPSDDGVAWDLPKYTPLPKEVDAQIFENNKTKIESQTDIGVEAMSAFYPELYK